MSKPQTFLLAVVVAIVWPAVGIIKGIATAVRRLGGATSNQPESSDV